MRDMRALAIMALLGGAALLHPSVSHAGDDDAGRMFAQRCAGCHTVPDPEIRTDLAWLDQVKRTS
jgi:cytochrome c2